MPDFFVTAINIGQLSLSKSDLEIIKQLDKNINLVPKSNIKELAAISFTSQASLSRLVKKMGFSSFSEFKFRIKDFLNQNKQQTGNPQDYLSTTIDEIKLTHTLNQAKMNSAAQLILNSAKCYTFGTGWKQLQLLNNFSTDLVYYDENLYSLRTKEDLINSTKSMNENMTVIIASVSGNISTYREAIELLKLKKVKIISITHQQDCELARISDISLFFVDHNLTIPNIHWSAQTLTYLLNLLIYYIVNNKNAG
ncbi:MurR/RpiR family transcriptional regulator [Lactobacillus sp. ESL0791]|uniref:MurR/RpiR family transcriptional regulator n=1 Tax=Lactobacillus sp. ESL0791 TaxID=2983234 RepID=UPI0023F78360|nr:MurR/RpiR family transcriptional regulator [Lactobacillus sp. ESL0791]MDF7639628.1 MurR/RpiR family transcriptional regulator [Lactobacillus sp. ESL0791]